MSRNTTAIIIIIIIFSLFFRSFFWDVRLVQTYAIQKILWEGLIPIADAETDKRSTRLVMLVKNTYSLCGKRLLHCVAYKFFFFNLTFAVN